MFGKVINLKSFFAELKKVKGWCLITIVFISLEALSAVYIPTLVADIVDNGIAAGDMRQIYVLGARMLAVAVLGIICSFCRNYSSSCAVQKFGALLREKVYSKIVVLEEGAADQIGLGSLITRLSNDTEQISKLLNVVLRIFCKSLVVVISSLVFSFFLDYRLSIILFFVVVLVAISIYIAMHISYVRFGKVQEAIDETNTIVQESLAGIRLIRAYGKTESINNKFKITNTKLSDNSYNTSKVFAIATPLMTLTINLSVVAALAIAGLLSGNAAIAVGKLSAFTTYIAQMTTSLLATTDVFRAYIRAKMSAKRLAEVFESRDEEDLGFLENCTELQSGNALEFKNVSFSYPSGSGVSAIKHLSFSLGKGETVAIIGATAAGKSTLCWLCLRLYEPDEGQILLGGQPINQMSIAQIRKQIALAPQYSALFSGTVADNILWGASEYADYVHAAEISEAYDFVSKMPNGFESVIGQGSTTFSGGQRQRLSIARAIAKDAPIIILDDCTSALDILTEKKLLNNLKTELENQSILLITQRLDTARRADRILVLENGAAAGLGTHEELFETCVVYRDICNSQEEPEVCNGRT